MQSLQERPMVIMAISVGGTPVGTNDQIADNRHAMGDFAVRSRAVSSHACAPSELKRLQTVAEGARSASADDGRANPTAARKGCRSAPAGFIRVALRG
jgi:hypothetical protein